MRQKEILGRELSTGRSILVTIENDIVTSIRRSEEMAALWISAGLVDLQVNGYLGLDLNGPDLTSATVSKLARALLATGVTTFAPTVITAPEGALRERIACIAEACAQDPIAAACIPYIHVEGPYISSREGYRGAHAADCVRPPSLAEFAQWQACCDGRVGLVTLSPHFPGSREYIYALRQQGVHVSLGHTHASQEEIQSAVHAGARLSTHLGNGIALQIDRHPNPIWSQLAENRLTASFIADGHHLPGEVLTAMLRAKGLERSILVSDLIALAGMPPGRYVTPVGGAVELTDTGRLTMKGTSTLAGAVLPLIACVGRAVQMTGFSLAQVISMTTESPGRFAGNRGRLRLGDRADIIRFEWDARESVAAVRDVWLAGEPVFTNT